MKQLFMLVALFSFCVSATAQEDLLEKKNGDKIYIKVTEIGDDVVRYKEYSNPNGPDFVVRKGDFARITLADGTVIDSPPSPPPVPSEGKEGFIGLSIGVNTLSEDYSNISSTGPEGCLTFGYLFSRIVGISASGFLNRHNVESSNADAKCNVYGAYAGPLFSIPVGARNKLRIHLIPYVGFAKMKVTGSQSGVSASLTLETEVVAGVNSMIAWKFADMWALTGGLEARYLKIQEDNFNSVKLSVGIALCF